MCKKYRAPEVCTNFAADPRRVESKGQYRTRREGCGVKNSEKHADAINAGPLTCILPTPAIQETPSNFSTFKPSMDFCLLQPRNLRAWLPV